MKPPRFFHSHCFDVGAAVARGALAVAVVVAGEEGPLRLQRHRRVDGRPRRGAALLRKIGFASRIIQLYQNQDAPSS